MGKYSLPQFRQGAERKELSNLRTSLPHLSRTTSDLDLVLEAITYIEQLQDRVRSYGQPQHQPETPPKPETVEEKKKSFFLSVNPLAKCKTNLKTILEKEEVVLSDKLSSDKAQHINNNS